MSNESLASNTLVRSAMQNQYFMEYVKQKGDDSIAGNIEAFFSGYSELTLDEQLEQLHPIILAHMWRLFVAYTLDVDPYSHTCTTLINQCHDKWDRLGLIALLDQGNSAMRKQIYS